METEKRMGSRVPSAYSGQAPPGMTKKLPSGEAFLSFTGDLYFFVRGGLSVPRAILHELHLALHLFLILMDVIVAAFAYVAAKTD